VTDTAPPVNVTSPPATVKPASKLARVLSMVPEGNMEEEEEYASLSQKTGMGSISTATSKDDAVSRALPLEAFACQGLLPRPDGCSHVFSYSNKTGITAVHLDRVPFTVRPADVNDAAALHRLQGHLPDKALRSRLSLHAIQTLVVNKRKNISWQWVAEVDGNLVAAILLGQGCDTSALEVKLLAVHPALEERAEVLFALLNFVLQLIIADTGVSELLQGNLNISGLQEGGDGGAASIDEGPAGVVARFTSTIVTSGKSKNNNSSLPFSLPSMQSNTRKNKNSGGGISQREATFTAGITLDDIAWIVGQATAVAKLESPYISRRKSRYGSNETTPDKHSSKITEAAGGQRRTTDAARRRSKLVSIVEEARRLTSSAGFNDPGTSEFEFIAAVVEIEFSCLAFQLFNALYFFLHLFFRC
jgi:hypothetical protein